MSIYYWILIVALTIALSTILLLIGEHFVGQNVIMGFLIGSGSAFVSIKTVFFLAGKKKRL